jgi:hypothetical protein
MLIADATTQSVMYLDNLRNELEDNEELLDAYLRIWRKP